MFFEKLEGDYLIYNFSVDKGLAKLLPETMFRNYVSVEKTHIYISQFLIILMHIFSQPCDFLRFDFLMIWVISFLVKETLSITLSVCSREGGSVLEFLTRKH